MYGISHVMKDKKSPPRMACCRKQIPVNFKRFYFKTDIFTEISFGDNVPADSVATTAANLATAL